MVPNVLRVVHTPNPRGVISSDFKYLSINRGDDDHCDCILARRGGRLGARGSSCREGAREAGGRCEMPRKRCACLDRC